MCIALRERTGEVRRMNLKRVACCSAKGWLQQGFKKPATKIEET